MTFAPSTAANQGCVQQHEDAVTTACMAGAADSDSMLCCVLENGFKIILLKHVTQTVNWLFLPPSK